eukprot:Nitzschia sp. Nitz4//scaffold71_size96697//57398//57988//NITZ4_004699-RA/size96697-processed-gene-0.10-mRNA-1//1//CDS//3329557259//4399//frame0
MSISKLVFCVLYSLSLTSVAAAWSLTAGTSSNIEAPSSNTVFVDAFLCESNWEMAHVSEDEESYTPPMAHRNEPMRMCFQLVTTSSNDATLGGIESFKFFDDAVAQDVLFQGAPVSPSETVLLKCEESRCMLEAMVDQSFFESGASTVQVMGAAVIQPHRSVAATHVDRFMLRKRQLQVPEPRQTVQFVLSIALDR